LHASEASAAAVPPLILRGQAPIEALFHGARPMTLAMPPRSPGATVYPGGSGLSDQG
jgi:hypothetical protein